MKMEKLTKFDVAEDLDTDELQILYLAEVAKENDPAEYSHEIAPLVANSAPLILTDEHHLIA